MKKMKPENIHAEAEIPTKTAQKQIHGAYASEYDVPILLEFFNRPKTFSQVFAVIKQVRPAVLLLYQDGPRTACDDEENHLRCRKIAEDIDWECTVYYWYQTENQGCDPSGFLAQKWAFTLVEQCIVLEDDCVPARSFFPYCKELLERYKTDDRINYICGMNNLAQWKPERSSYFFGRRGSICGWASWRRVVLDRYENYDWVNDAYLKELGKRWKPCRNWRDIEKRYRYCAKTGKQYFEVLGSERQLRHNAWNIIPSVNMIKNIGNEKGTHSDLELREYPRFWRRVMEMNANEIPFPLKHPKEICPDNQYDRAMDPTWVQKRVMRIEGVLLKLYYRGIQILWSKRRNR